MYHGNSKAPKLIVFGDSHAGMLASGIIKHIAKPFHVTTYLVAGGFQGGKYLSTLPLPGLTRRVPGNQANFDRSAQKQLHDAMRALKQDKESVLLVSFSYIDQFPTLATIDNHQLLSIDLATASNPSEYAPFLVALERLRLQLGGRSLILMGDVPQSSYKPIECMVPVRWLSYLKRCDKQDAEDRHLGSQHINAVLSDYANKHQKVFFIDPYVSFCVKGYCQNLNPAGVPYYSDGNHLSKTGANHWLRQEKELILSAIGLNR